MSRSPRRALLERIARERVVARAMPELPSPWRARAAVAVEGDRVPEAIAGVSDRALHALAAVAGVRLAIALDADEERVVEARARALLRSWLALAERHAYVDRTAAAIAGDVGDARRVVARLGVDRLARALDDRAGQGREIGGLLRALAEASGSELAPIADRARRDAIDRFAEPVRRTLDELATRRATTDEICAAFELVLTAWRRCDRDVELEILAVERLGDFAWDLYRERALDDLARLLRIVSEPSASLAARVARGEAVAWAAPCAQVRVFLAELAPSFDAQLALAERAFAVCPTLRNARVVLGDFLLTRAERALDRGAARTSAGTLPDDDVARAASLHPELKRLAVVREKLDRRARRAS